MTPLEENNELLNFLLDKRFFEPWKEHKEDDGKGIWSRSQLEIYITAQCNQKCEYCYLHKHPELYPKEYEKEELILKNLGILYDWIIEKGYSIPRIEFFSGEIWHTQLGRRVLSITLEALDRGLKVREFMIPTNGSFLREDESFFAIQNFIDNFWYRGVALLFSLSIDGKIVENEERPLNTGEKKDDEFYERAFIFARHNGFYFHPMVAAGSAGKWIENFKWFEGKFKEYDLNINRLMLLEVRNDDWDEKSIGEYNRFLDFLMEKTFNRCKRDPKLFAGALIGENFYLYGDGEDDGGGGYIPYSLALSDTFPGCTVADSLTVRLGDMAICPCHRTAYNKYLYGYFKLKDGKIDSIEANNPQAAVRILLGNNHLCHFGCDTCKYVSRCLQGCFGAQLEATGEMFMPIPSVCGFFKAKTKHILSWWEEHGVIKALREVSPYSMYYVEAKSLCDFYDSITEEGE